MDAVGLEAALIVGSSSGGYVAQRFALDHPGRVSALVLIGTPRSLRSRPAILDVVSALTDPIDRAFVSEFVQSTVSGEASEEFLERMIGESCQVAAAVWKATLAGRTRLSDASWNGRLEALRHGSVR